jgi:hypothetical protein
MPHGQNEDQTGSDEKDCAVCGPTTKAQPQLTKLMAELLVLSDEWKPLRRPSTAIAIFVRKPLSHRDACSGDRSAAHHRAIRSMSRSARSVMATV